MILEMPTLKNIYVCAQQNKDDGTSDFITKYTPESCLIHKKARFVFLKRKKNFVGMVRSVVARLRDELSKRYFSESAENSNAHWSAEMGTGRPK